MTIDQLLSLWAKRWPGFTTNGKGVLVPAVKASELPQLSTRSAEFKVKEKAYNADQRQIIGGMANANEMDRMVEIVDPMGGQFSSYEKNSILLAQHCHADPIGLVTMLSAEQDGVKFEAWIGDPAAGPLTSCQMETRSLVAQGILRAVSIGFIPHEIQYPTYNERGDIVEPAIIKAWEMLELSVVSVPCNANSLFDVKKNDSETKKVYSFYKSSSDDNVINNQINLEAPEMEKLEQLLTKLAETLSGIDAGIKALAEGQSKLLEKVGDDKPADDEKPADDDEMKQVKADIVAIKADLTNLNTTSADLIKAIQALAGKKAS